MTTVEAIRPSRQLVPVAKKQISAREKVLRQSLTACSADSAEYIRKIEIAKGTLGTILNHHADICMAASGKGRDDQIDRFFADVAEVELGGVHLIMAAMDELLRLKIKAKRRNARRRGR